MLPRNAGPGRREGPRLGCGKAREEERPLPQTIRPFGRRRGPSHQVPQMDGRMDRLVHLDRLVD